MRTLLLWLLLTLAAVAEGPRDWLVTMADLKGKLPQGYRFNPRFEKFRESSAWTTKFYAYEYFDRRKNVLLTAQCTKHPSAVSAQMTRAPMNMAFSANNSHFKDFSKVVSAGEESSCYQLEEFGWLFTFRDKRIEGMLVVGGARLTVKEMDGLVDAWLARIRAQTRKKPAASKGFWPFAKSPKK